MEHRLTTRFVAVLSVFLLTSETALAACVAIPDGNRNASQPGVPKASKKRTQQTKSTFERKYEKIRDLIGSDKKLRGKIEKVADAYDIDPIHIVGALVGEHTYNVDAYDRLQSYYVKAVSYATGTIRFKYDGELVQDFVERPEFEICDEMKGSWNIWSCREQVWNAKFRGQEVDGSKFPADRFSAVFFQPFYAGQTFGLGQLNPLTALKLTDQVNKVSRYRKLTPKDAGNVYKAIMDPDITLAYMAASLDNAISAYCKVAGFDISGNPGVTATLYNLGTPDIRAQKLASTNKKRKSRGRKPILPEENYYGWLVNDKLDELRALF